jgi:hypothetical protein
LPRALLPGLFSKPSKGLTAQEIHGGQASIKKNRQPPVNKGGAKEQKAGLFMNGKRDFEDAKPRTYLKKNQ